MTTQEAINYFAQQLSQFAEAREIGAKIGWHENTHYAEVVAEAQKIALTALQEKLARKQGCEECLHYEPYFTPPPYPCNECLRSKSDMWQSNAAQPQEGEKA